MDDYKEIKSFCTLENILRVQELIKLIREEETINTKEDRELLINIWCLFNSANELETLKEYLIELDYVDNEETINNGIQAYKLGRLVVRLFGVDFESAYVDGYIKDLFDEM